MTALKDLRALSPASFFELRAKVPQLDKKGSFKRGFLPDTRGLTGEGKLAAVALLWSSAALHFLLEVNLELEEGDFFELFIDTRDMKSSNVITRFCHHFIFYPYEETGIEATRFRSDESHELADSTLLRIKTEKKRTSYQCEINIPKEALHGYAPEEFKRLGFSYRFQKKNGEKKHFNLSSNFFNLEKHPALWATLELMEN